VAFGAGRARGADRDRAAREPDAPADLRRSPAQRLHAARWELPRSGRRVADAALPAEDLPREAGRLTCGGVGCDWLARLRRGDRLPPPAAARALLRADSGDQRQLGELRAARGAASRRPEHGRAVRPEHLPLRVAVLARPRANALRAALAAPARPVPVLALRPPLRRAGAGPARDPRRRVQRGVACRAGLPAVPPPDGVHRPGPRLPHAAAEGKGDLRPRARDRDRRPRRQLPRGRTAPPADAREPAGHRLCAALREVAGPARPSRRASPTCEPAAPGLSASSWRASARRVGPCTGSAPSEN
jgi:hypothetical protein